MAEQQSIYEVLIRFGLDATKAKEAAKEVQKLSEASNKTTSSVNGMSNAFKQVVQQGMGLIGISSILGTIIKATQTYNAQVGTTEKTSREWIQSTQMIEAGWVKVGRAIEQFLLPEMKTLAQLVTIVTTEGGLQAIGDAMMGGWKQDGNYKVGPNGALTRVDPTGSSNNGQYGVQGGMIGPAAPGYGVRGGLIGPPSPSGGNKEAVRGIDWNNVDEVKKAYQYNQQTLQIQRQADMQKAKMQRDYNQQERYALADFQKSLFRSKRDFDRSLVYQDADFNRQRVVAARDFGIQMVRSETDFQRQRSRATQDHEFDLYQIAMSGDAMQYWLSERSFNLQKSRAEEDYNIQKSRSQEDFDRQMSDQQTQFGIERNRTLEQFQISLADQEQDFALQRARSLFAYNQNKKDLDISLAEQKRMRQQAVMDEIMLSRTNYDNITQLRGMIGQTEADVMSQVYDLGMQYYNSLNEANPYSSSNSPAINIPPNGPGNSTGYWVPGYALGGYTGNEVAQLHQGEFVMTANTVRAAEGAARSTLSQDTLSQLFSGGKGITYNDHRAFSTSVSAEDRRAIKADTQDMLLTLLG